MRFLISLLIAVIFIPSAVLADRLESIQYEVPQNASANFREALGKFRENRFREALPLFQSECDINVAIACTFLGQMYYDGNGVSRNKLRAHELFTLACNNNEGIACHNLAASLQQERAVESVPLRKELFEKACANNILQSCMVLGRQSYTSVSLYWIFAPKEDPPTLECDNSNVAYCDQIMQTNSTSLPFSFRKMVRDFGRSCQASNYSDCLNYIFMSPNDNDRARLAAAAKAFYKACTADVWSACRMLYVSNTNLFEFLEREKSPAIEYADTVFARACAANQYQICLAHDRSQFCCANYSIESESAILAIERTDHACANNYIPACFALGELFSNVRIGALDYARAASLFSVACSHNNDVACHHLATLNWRGLGIPQDKNRAIELYRRGCTAVLANSCYALAIAMQDNSLGVANSQRANQLIYLTCASGIGAACYDLAKSLPPQYTGRSNLLEDACNSGRIASACRELAQLIENIGGNNRGKLSKDGLLRYANSLEESPQFPIGEEILPIGDYYYPR